MKWTITYFNENVENSVAELPVKIRARYFALTDRMEVVGPDLGMPHTSPMGDGLFELRVKAQEGIARVMYCTQLGHEIIILSCFVKKTQKTQKNELEIERKGLKEVKHHG